MIEEKELLHRIRQLPEKLQEELLHFAEFLQAEYSVDPESIGKKKRKAGSSPGKYKLAPDFDAPLEDVGCCSKT
jgi:Protein of unknown function (DUF2281)